MDVGAGSVARILWGDDYPTLVTSQDVVLDPGLNEYCFADMTKVPAEASASGAWTPPVTILRLDPHEFPVSSECVQRPGPKVCHDIRIESFTLAPYDSADPYFRFQWAVTDHDSADVDVSVYLDLDGVYNGNELPVALASVLGGSTSGGMAFVATTGNVSPGTYDVLFVSDDGINQVARYAAGKLDVLSTIPDVIFRNGFD